MIRVWGSKGKGDWNEYWRLGRLLDAQDQLEADFRAHGVEHVDICPSLWKPPSTPESLLDIEVFIPPGEGLNHEDPLVAEIIKRHTRLWAGPSPANVESELEERVNSHLLYLRQRFLPWDGQLPRFILGVDFDQGLRNFKLRPKHPERWRKVDHDIGGIDNDRRALPAILLDANEKGGALLEKLEKTFTNWRPGVGHVYNMPLDAVLEYRRVLMQHGCDCNDAFRDGLAEGWYPIDIGPLLSTRTIRTLVSTPLPDHLADLLDGDVDGGTGRNYIHFQFAALTDN